MLIRLGIWVASALGLYTIATNGDNGENGIFIENPEFDIPDPDPDEDKLIDFDMPLGFGVDVSKWMLAVPLLWITFKYKPWK